MTQLSDSDAFQLLPQAWQENLTAVPNFESSKEQLLTILLLLAQLPNKTRHLIAIDGPCGSGKTTLAEKLATILGVAVIHMDDFLIPFHLKTPERLSIPGGNVDIERLQQEVLQPYANHLPIAYRRYDCHADQFSDVIALPEQQYTILEGNGSLLPKIRALADCCFFLRISPDKQQERLLQRVGKERLADFKRLWIPLENTYFSAYHLPDEHCIVIDT